ncbi:zonular occludens toxin domain-containing protein [Xanthomonas nasturtii]|uniref:zonular occludens toxin domain-containing protein n=2 Tax=Xanthomonas nasturtii TaxID=1843581 RepID=UPI0020111E32|nr:zonular occludens toxin domain-containing protein [Xanthomonas nasturtii]MCL1569547.1 zonular occludens toxin domain-containing protein [Xanthomonas nasturtii]MCL1573373.1 zonular occludens toxin domain-containing protein [Xanthomonas nasturtii]MCL1581153.1 zonular occludens toxin domain-containing protein [Xanthomonas nasturtii]MCL1585034.1 zonular occludens toxin domain-containing protein [Xanthomonas nasturtii]MCL1592688.1 zonular occludens toxin domain-containing protein [Xanthomonas na
MFVFNEGVPRSGKSYDCIKNHVLPSLKRGRHVWARLNGLEDAGCRKAIAAYLELPESHIEKFLHHVETKDVVETFKARQDKETKRWVIEDHFKDALVVIDEIHEFYVESRQPLDPATEQFFALLGQNGGDGIIMTQMFKRLHEAVRGRIERKHSFQKLSAFGMDGRYRVTFNHSISAGKFQKIGSKVEKYDKAIFPLYHGYAPGSTNTEVYKEGSKTVWPLVAGGLIIALVVFGLAGWWVLRFFREPEHMFKDGRVGHAQAAPASSGAPASVVGQTFKPGQAMPLPGAATAPAAPPPKPDPKDKLNPEQRFVVDLGDMGRLRLAAMAKVGEQTRAWVEWIDTGNNAVQMLDLDQLRDLGMEVTVASYGVRLKAGDIVQVATAWPRQPNVREPEARTYNTAEAGGVGGGAGVRASAQSPARDPGTSGVTIERAPRALGTFPESKAYSTATYTGPTTLDM